MDNAQPTPYPELDAVLQELVSSIQDILRDNFVGAYLQGSFAIGDFDQHSDVDFIIVTHQDLNDEQVAALQRMHERIYHLPVSWAQHLEGSYFPKELLKDYTQRGGEVWYVDHGATVIIRHKHCNTLVVRWTLREKGVTLHGPPSRHAGRPHPGGDAAQGDPGSNHTLGARNSQRSRALQQPLLPGIHPTQLLPHAALPARRLSRFKACRHRVGQSKPRPGLGESD
jgi:hypothetical protein